MGLVLLLATGELAPTNVLGFCVAASNAFGLIAGRARPPVPCPCVPILMPGAQAQAFQSWQHRQRALEIQCAHARAGIFLMGYGLVAVPRQLWRTADIKGAERASYHKAGLQADRAIAAKQCVLLRVT